MACFNSYRLRSLLQEYLPARPDEVVFDHPSSQALFLFTLMRERETGKKIEPSNKVGLCAKLIHILTRLTKCHP